MNLILKNSAIFLIYLLLQVFIFNHFHLGGVATAHVFVLFLLMLPISLPFPLAITVGFFAGLLLDIFSVGAFIGIHAFCGVLLMALRNFWVDVITNRFSFRGSEEYMLTVQPANWYVQYLGPLILVHQVAYYLLDAFSFANFPLTLLKIITSSIFTFAVTLMLTLLIHKEGKR